MSNLSYMQKATDRGQLQIHVTTERGFFPIKDASIRLSYTGNTTEIIEELSTDISGQTAAVELPAPPLEYSMEPSEFQPYSEYTIQVNASGYRPINISGISVPVSPPDLQDMPVCFLPDDTIFLHFLQHRPVQISHHNPGVKQSPHENTVSREIPLPGCS